MSYMPRRLDHLYVYPPPSLAQGSADHLVRNSHKSVYLHHVFDHPNVKECVLNDLHEFRILVGNRKYAFTECPCKGNDKRRRGNFCLKVSDFNLTLFSGTGYYRPYLEPRATYLYLRGYSLSEATEFYRQLRQFSHIGHIPRRMFQRWKYKSFVPYELTHL